MTLAPLIITAGGKSSRMRHPKGLLEFERRPWILEQLRRFAAAGGSHAVVVLGFEADRYFEALPGWRHALEHPIQEAGVALSVVVNARPEHGPFSSVQAGARTDGRDGRAAFAAYVLPVDVPAPAPETWLALARALEPEIDACIPSREDKGGHPILLSSRFLASLRRIDPAGETARLDARIRGLPTERVRRVPVASPEIVSDLNTPDAWREYVARIHDAGGLATATLQR